jgi:hypothetical protein
MVSFSAHSLKKLWVTFNSNFQKKITKLNSQERWDDAFWHRAKSQTTRLPRNYLHAPTSSYPTAFLRMSSILWKKIFQIPVAHTILTQTDFNGNIRVQ